MKSLGILILIGAIVFIIAPMIAENATPVKEGVIEKQFKVVTKTPEAKAVFNSDEFQNLIVTPEFFKLAKLVGRQAIIDYLNLM